MSFSISHRLECFLTAWSVGVSIGKLAVKHQIINLLFKSQCLAVKIKILQYYRRFTFVLFVTISMIYNIPSEILCDQRTYGIAPCFHSHSSYFPNNCHPPSGMVVKFRSQISDNNPWLIQSLCRLPRNSIFMFFLPRWNRTSTVQPCKISLILLITFAPDPYITSHHRYSVLRRKSSDL